MNGARDVDCFVFRPADTLSGRKPRSTRLARPRLESSCGLTELFIFTPPVAAIRFADGARKSFSIATCLAQ